MDYQFFSKAFYFRIYQIISFFTYFILKYFFSTIIKWHKKQEINKQWTYHNFPVFFFSFTCVYVFFN